MKKLAPSILFGALFGVLTAFALRPSMITATTCDYQTSPLLIEEATPRFGWQLKERKGRMQSAYAIEVEDETGSLVWESGKVLSDKSQLIPYEGAALKPQNRYRWRVRVWDERDKASRWSRYASFATAPTTAWLEEAEWIGAITYADARMPEGRKFHGGELKKPEVRAAWEAVDSLAWRSILLRKEFEAK